ncbi:MAG: hypothetical protein IT324_18555 [Anaerolineae bacterium]|nr:hypothetical protein [Anaerolineae bacterium]
MQSQDADKKRYDPTEAESADPLPSAIRIKPDQADQQPEVSEAAEGSANAESQVHMGASEDQIIREKPPTGALSDMLEKPGGPAPNDELTPG